MFKLTDAQIIAVLNKIALNEFKRNYNKSEMARVAEELCDLYQDELVEKLEQRLLAEVEDPTKIRIKVSNFGTLTVWEPYPEMGNCWKQVKYLSYNLKLPYAYVMGKKVGKRVMLEVVSQYE